jgi:hypothetical protein
MKKVGSLIFIFVALLSCKKLTQLSPIPHIEYRSFSVFDTTDILGNHSIGGRLRFYFEDGDGDIGLEDPTEGQTESTDLFLTLYWKDNGEMVPADDNNPLKYSSYRIPYMEKLGRDKILKGNISVTILYLFDIPADTISYEFYLKDRALNESNVETTNEIVLSKNSTYK